MKVEVEEISKKAGRPFPKLMISQRGTLVLFTSSEVGTLLKGADHPIGYHASDFDSECFKDFEGEITLSND